MSQVAFKLESFSDAPPPPCAMVEAQAVEIAYREGLTEGRAAGFSAELRSLTDAITAVEAELSDSEQIRAAAYAEALAALAPLLHEIVTALADQASSAMLEAALIREVQCIVADAPGTGWHILCPPGMEQVIRRCANAAGADMPDIRATPGIADAQIVMDQGRIVISKSQVATRFRDLISELQESLS